MHPTRHCTRPAGNVPLPDFQQQGSLTCHTATGTNPAAQLPTPLLLSDPQGGKGFGSFSAQLSRELGRLGWTDGAGQRSLLVAVQSSQLRSDPSQVRNTHIHPRMAQRQRCLLPPQHQPVCRAQPVTCTAHRSGCCSWGKAQVCSGDAALAARCCRVTGQGETQFLLIARVLWCVTTLGKLLQRSWLQAEARILYKNTHIYLLERT